MGCSPTPRCPAPPPTIPTPIHVRLLFSFLAVQGAFDIADPHLFIEEWASHVRNLPYATVGDDTILIQTDFSAQYPHKAAWTNTCEHPPTSNMDVFVVTRVLIDAEGKRKELAPPPSPHHPAQVLSPNCFVGMFITDVWRIFSAAKGSSAFHNKCLWQITQFYRGVIELKVVVVFTDGCRGQYKGRRNFLLSQHLRLTAHCSHI